MLNVLQNKKQFIKVLLSILNSLKDTTLTKSDIGTEKQEMMNGNRTSKIFQF